MNYQNYRLHFSFNGLATPLYVVQMAKEISKLIGCKTEVISYMDFKVQDCAFSLKEIKRFLKDAYSGTHKMDVFVQQV